MEGYFYVRIFLCNLHGLALLLLIYLFISDVRAVFSTDDFHLFLKFMIAITDKGFHVVVTRACPGY